MFDESTWDQSREENESVTIELALSGIYIYSRHIIIFSSKSPIVLNKASTAKYIYNFKFSSSIIVLVYETVAIFLLPWDFCDLSEELE